MILMDENQASEAQHNKQMQTEVMEKCGTKERTRPGGAGGPNEREVWDGGCGVTLYQALTSHLYCIPNRLLVSFHSPSSPAFLQSQPMVSCLLTSSTAPLLLPNTQNPGFKTNEKRDQDAVRNLSIFSWGIITPSSEGRSQ